MNERIHPPSCFSISVFCERKIKTMNCFYIFKGKWKGKGEAKSAPELRGKSKLEDSTLKQITRSLPSPKSIPELYQEKEPNLRDFSYQELRDATNDFNRSLKIGEGGFGNVYKGTILTRVNGQGGNPTVVAIKRLNKQGMQGHKEWLAEVLFLGVIDHPNVVKLLGYCSTDDERGIQRLLVYEFMPNRSLEDHLFSKDLPSLPWKTRLEVMLGAAQGLDYLHTGLEVQVIYRDFKSSNVLLDKHFNPKLSDFGLAREGPKDDRSHVSTAAVGTYGYAAPEYVETGKLYVASDAWTFGVVLYEIITGRRTLERSRPTAEQKLLTWVKQFPPDSKRFSAIIDSRLVNQYPIGSARKVASLADRCLNKIPQERPTMCQIVETLKEVIHELGEERSNGSTSKKRSK